MALPAKITITPRLEGKAMKYLVRVGSSTLYRSYSLQEAVHVYEAVKLVNTQAKQFNLTDYIRYYGTYTTWQFDRKEVRYNGIYWNRFETIQKAKKVVHAMDLVKTYRVNNPDMLECDIATKG